MSETSGLFGSLKRLLATVLGIVSTRIELLANEWEEERLRLMRLLLLSLLAVFCACMGAVLLTIFIVVSFWHDHPLLAISIPAMTFFALSALFALMLKRVLQQGSALFSVSLAELRQDRQHLGEEHE